MDNAITFMDVLQWCTDNFYKIILVLGIFFEISPIKFNPITWVLNLIYKPIREELKKLKDELNTKIDSVKDDLKTEIDQLKAEQVQNKDTITELIKSNEMSEISRLRWEIIEFSNSIDNNQKHTRDEYRHIKDDNRRYHALIAKYEMQNGVIDEEMEKINSHYDANKDSTSVYF